MKLTVHVIGPSPAPAPVEPATPSSPPEASPVARVTEQPAPLPEEKRCDACDAPLTREEDDTEGGRGLYIWSRHGEVVYEEPPLCASCARAITATALQRWEIEEEEG